MKGSLKALFHQWPHKISFSEVICVCVYVCVPVGVCVCVCVCVLISQMKCNIWKNCNICMCGDCLGRCVWGIICLRTSLPTSLIGVTRLHCTHLLGHKVQKTIFYFSHRLRLEVIFIGVIAFIFGVIFVIVFIFSCVSSSITLNFTDWQTLRFV